MISIPLSPWGSVNAGRPCFLNWAFTDISAGTATSAVVSFLRSWSLDEDRGSLAEYCAGAGLFSS
jgi:hypothetical protein